MKKPSESNQGTFLPQGLAAPFLEAEKIRKPALGRRDGARDALKRHCSEM
jgi:hypothetical protein